MMESNWVAGAALDLVQEAVRQRHIDRQSEQAGIDPRALAQRPRIVW